jgi:pimeloyl-ACP methyl ester carboxylesterase
MTKFVAHVSVADGEQFVQFRRFIALLLMAGTVLAAPAEPPRRVSDLAREQRMASEISDAILDGTPVTLETADGQGFLGIFTASFVLPVKGTVVILHGRGFHPDWDDVIHPLRVGLPASGWNTLSIQLPVLEKSARYYDYLAIFDAADSRIDAAVAEAREHSPVKVIILAHSCGSHMAQHWMHSRGRQGLQQFDAFVGIGMGATDYGQPMREPFALNRIKVPVLDIYAENDFPAVRRLAPQRRAAMLQGGNPSNEQMIVEDADHYFVDRGDVLLEAVAIWLDSI